MTLWRFTPVAAADDPQWQDHPRWEEVVVAADSLGEALMAAAHDLGTPPHPAGNETPNDTNGLGNEKLYRVDRVDLEDLHGVDRMPERSPAIVKAVPAEIEPVPPRTDILDAG